MIMLRLAFTACFISLLPLGAIVHAETLERVVIVERHGIRAPSKSPEALAKFADHAWPSWPVAPGDLTPHGAQNLKLLGAWMRKNYAQLGLLPASGCPGQGDVFVWADSKDRRTSESGDALLDGLAPGCGLSAHHAQANTVDPVFDGIASGACKLDAAEATASISKAMKGGLESLVPGYGEALAQLRGILRPKDNQSACSSGKTDCLIGGRNQLVVDSEEAKVSGPLATASMLTEALSLEYDEGMEPEKLGWKPLTLESLEAIAPLHNGYNNLTRKDSSVSRHNGAVLVQDVAKAIEGTPAFLGQNGKGARLTIVFGHDTTLENMAGIFKLDWALKKQPDNTPPGGALIFEIYRDEKTAGEFVKVSMLYQTADQLRLALPFDGLAVPARIDLQPGTCPDQPGSSCTLKDFQSIIDTSVPEVCKRQ